MDFCGGASDVGDGYVVAYSAAYQAGAVKAFLCLAMVTPLKPDIAYILTSAEKVEDWIIHVLIRYTMKEDIQKYGT